MNFEEKAKKFQDDLIREHFDSDDGYYYNTCKYGNFWYDKKLARDNFIDGMTWVGLLFSSCLQNPTDINLEIAKKSVKFFENIFLVAGDNGRLARTYRILGGGNWKPSPTMSGYFYLENQSREGHLGFSYATRACIYCSATPIEIKQKMLNLYVKYVRKLIEDKYENLNPDGSKGTYWDNLLPWGLSGVFSAPISYTAVALGAEVAEILGSNPKEFIDEADHIWRDSWMQQLDFFVGLWTGSFSIFNYLLHRIRGKYSNESTMYQLASPWMLGIDEHGLFSGDRRRVIRQCGERLHKMTYAWEMPYFDAIWSILCKTTVDASVISRWLEDFPIERRKLLNFDDTKIKKIIPLKLRKPTAWMWRQDPFEQYIAKEPIGFVELSYAPSDYVAAYNLCKAAKIV